MSLFTILMEIVLLIWFFGCICTYRLGKYLLVEGVGIKSAEFVMFCLYGIGIIARLVFLMVGKWYLLVVLILWLVIQFFCHWYYTIFGASEIKLKGYNECFKETVRNIPVSETRRIPNMFHMVYLSYLYY